MSHPLVERLARDHQDHLRWLQAHSRGRLAVEEAEDVLQAAYVKAIAALGDPGGTLPRFESHDKARAWLRQIANRIAIDQDRASNGRDQNRGKRPQQVTLDTPEGPLPIPDERVDVETNVVNQLERDEQQPVILRALESLPEEHRQILKLRYADSLEPQAIMFLQNINRRQYEGRHTRALKAFANALAKLPFGSQCGQTRLLLKHHAEALLNPQAVSAARDHIDSCLVCRAFAKSSQSALAVLPLPIPLLMWKLDALQYFAGSPSSSSSTVTAGAPPVGGESSGSWFASAGKTLAAHKISVLAVSAVAGVGGASFAVSAGVDSPQKLVLGQTTSTSADGSHGQTRWASSQTQREALERAAREAQKRREQARRSGQARDDAV